MSSRYATSRPCVFHGFESPQERYQLYRDPPKHENFRCVGAAKTTQDGTCRNFILEANRVIVVASLLRIRRRLRLGTNVDEDLLQVAELALCKRWHRAQARSVALEWKSYLLNEERERARAAAATVASAPVAADPNTVQRQYGLTERPSGHPVAMVVNGILTPPDTPPKGRTPPASVPHVTEQQTPAISPHTHRIPVYPPNTASEDLPSPRVSAALDVFPPPYSLANPLPPAPFAITPPSAPTASILPSVPTVSMLPSAPTTSILPSVPTFALPSAPIASMLPSDPFGPEPVTPQPESSPALPSVSSATTTLQPQITSEAHTRQDGTPSPGPNPPVISPTPGTHSTNKTSSPRPKDHSTPRSSQDPDTQTPSAGHLPPLSPLSPQSNTPPTPDTSTLECLLRHPTNQSCTRGTLPADCPFCSLALEHDGRLRWCKACGINSHLFCWYQHYLMQRTDEYGVQQTKCPGGRAVGDGEDCACDKLPVVLRSEESDGVGNSEARRDEENRACDGLPVVLKKEERDGLVASEVARDDAAHPCMPAPHEFEGGCLSWCERWMLGIWC